MQDGQFHIEDPPKKKKIPRPEEVLGAPRAIPPPDEILGVKKKEEAGVIGSPISSDPFSLRTMVGSAAQASAQNLLPEVSLNPQSRLQQQDAIIISSLSDKKLTSYLGGAEALSTLNLNDDKSIAAAISVLDKPFRYERDEKGVTTRPDKELEQSKAETSLLLKQRLMLNKSQKEIDDDIKAIQPTIKDAVTRANMRRERGENIPTEKLFGVGVNVDDEAADHFAAGLNYLKDANPTKFKNITRALAEKGQVADTDFEQVAEVGKLIRQYQGKETSADYYGTSYQSKKAEYARAIGEHLKQQGKKGGEFAGVTIKKAAEELGLTNQAIVNDLIFEENLIGYDAIPKSGGIEAFVRGVQTPVSGITNTMERWFNESDADTYLKSQALDVGIGQKVPDKKGQITAELPSDRGNIWYDALEGFGQFIPQVLLTRGLGGIAVEGVGAAIPSAVATATKANRLTNILGTLPSVYLQEYGNAYQDALNKTGDPSEARAMGFMNAGAAAGFELFLPDAKIAQKAAGIFKAKYADDLIDLIKKGGDISDLSAKGRNIIGKFVAEVGSITTQEIKEEVATNITNYLTETIFSPETAKQRDLGSELLETAKATAVQMIIPALLGGGGGVNRDFTKNGLHAAAINIDEFKKSLNRALIEDHITEAENNDAIRILETHRRNIHTAPQVNINDKPLSEEQKLEFAFQETSINILNKQAEGIASEVQKEVVENKIKKAQDIQREILATDVAEERKDTFTVTVETTPEEKIIGLVNSGAVLGGAEMAVKADPAQATEALRFIAQQAYGITETGEKAVGGIAEIENKEALAAAKERFPSPESTLVKEQAVQDIPATTSEEEVDNEILSGKKPVYHGTLSEFEEFDPEFLGGNTGTASAKEGFFFASNKRVAESYATDNLLKYKGLEKQADIAREEIKKLTNGKDTEITLPSKLFRESVHGVESGYSPEVVKKLNKQLNKISAFEDFQNTMDDSYFAPEGKLARSGKIKETYLDIKNPFIKDYKGESFRDEKYSDVIKKAKQQGHDAVIFKNTFDGSDKTIGDEPTDVYVVFDKSQIKSKSKSDLPIGDEKVEGKKPAEVKPEAEPKNRGAKIRGLIVPEEKPAPPVEVLPEETKKPEPKPKKEKSAKAKKEVKEGLRKVRDEKIKAEIDAAWDEFLKGDDLLTSGGLDPKKIEAGTKLVGLYIKGGVYKFADILEDAYAKFGDKLNDYVDALKAVYGAYYNSQATDEEAEKMDFSTRNIQLKDIIKTQSDDRGTNIVDEPQVVPSTPPVAKGEPQRDVRPDEPGGKAEVGAGKGRDSGQAERVVGEQEDADRPGGRDSEGEHDVALNGNEKLNEELGGTSEEQPIPEPKDQTPIVSPLQHNGNFIIPPDFTNAKTFNVGQKLQDNIDAIRVLITLDKEDRKPTYDEQKTLFKYVGWGGIKEIGFDPNSDSGWTGSNNSLRPKIKEALELIKELDPNNQARNIAAIKSSVLNAHYTAIPVIRGIWNVIRKGGFKGGNVLEPSAGTGNFIGAMPIDFIERSKIIGIELDFVTSQILKNLYPNHITKNYGYEEAPIGEGNADLVISNIPFGNYAVHDPNFLKSKDPVLKKATKKIHSYFFARAIRDLKPNGIIAFVTTTGILDSKDNKELREMIAQRTEFLGAIRLPNDSFKGNANTSVTTDIIFLRKFGASEPATQRHDFLDTAAKSVKHKDRDETFKVFYNEYFHDNPEMVLGEVRAGSMYGASKDNLTDAMTVLPTGINIEEGISKLGSKIFSKETTRTETDSVKESAKSFVKDNGERIGNIVEISEGVYGVVGDVIENQETGERSRAVNTIRVAKKYQAALKDLIPLRGALNELYAAEYGDMGEDFINSKRAALNKSYKTFVKNNGTLLENKPLLDIDIDGYNMLALEKVEGKKVTGLADIFTKRVFQPKQRVERAASVSDAIVINLNETGGVDINRVAELLGVTPEEAIEQSKGILFKNPEGGFETKDKYLSGKVREKLDAARVAAAQDKFYEQNVTALEAVQPKDLNASQIYAPISASWISTKYLNDFASDLFKQNVTLNRLSTGRVNVSGEDYNTQVTEEYGTSRMDGFLLLEEAVQNRMPIVKDTIDDGVSKKSVVNEIETQKAVEKAEKIKAQFDKWIWADDDRRNDLVNYYNQHFNNVVVRKYDGSHLTFDGYAGELTPKAHQLDGAWMIMQQMGGILDHVVGSGKTLLMVLTAQKMKEMGLIKKPIIIGLKANTGDVADRYRKSFPLAKVLSPTEKDFTPDNRKAFFAKMANNDWDAIIMTHDQFGMITQSREIQMEIIQQEIDALEEDIRTAKANQMSKRDLNGLETRKQNLKAKLLSLTTMAKDKSLKSFEDMAIDFMFVDESQMFKNLSYNTIQRGVAGLGNPLGSNKAFNMLVATRTLQRMYGGDKGTVFASGTPISNTMVEMYLLFKYLRPHKMAEMGINSFDQWANTFARVGSEIEFGVTNSLKPKVRMRDFMNVPEMSAMYREIADVRNDSNLKLEKPEFKKTLRVKTDQNIPAFETVRIGENRFKVIGRIKGIEKNEYWISLKSIGKDVKVPASGKMIFGGSTINYSDTEYSDGLLINVVPTVEQRKFAKRIQKFAETKEGSWIGRPGLTDKEKKAYMLLATNLASKMAIDMRLVDPRYPSSEEGKIAVAADTIVDHYNESTHLKGIQLVFSDLGTPKTGNTAENLFNLIESRGVDRETLETIFGSGAYSEKPSYPPLKVLAERVMTALEYSTSELEDAVKEANEDNFNVYQELKDKLIKRGIPAEEIVFIHDYKSDKQKKTLFSNARAGKVRVIIGSTSKLGTGVNVQEKIVAMHHLDVPWRPSDMEQRNGRGIRQGNKIIEEFYDNELPVYMYATESTLDAYKYQLLGTKQQFIDQAKTGDLESREISEGEGDEETGISFSAMTAMLSGNPVILEKAKIDKKAKELETSRKAFEQEKFSLKDKISKLKERIRYSTNRSEGLKKDKQLFESNAVKNDTTGELVYEATISGEKFSEKAEKTPEQIAEAEIVKKLGKDFKEPKVGSEYTFRDGEQVKIESTIDEPDGKKWQVRIKGKIQFLTTEQIKSNVTGEKKEKTVRQRVGEKITELRNSYIKNDRYTPEKIGTIYGFNIIMKRNRADRKVVEIGVQSPVSDVEYYPTQAIDPVTIASFLQRQVRNLGDEIEAIERTVAMAEEDVKEKTKYLQTLPETFPKQAQLEETLAQQQRVTERLREMTTAAKFPTIEELESLGQRLYATPSELELEDVYAITEDNVVLKINDKPELTDAESKNSRYYIYKEEERGSEEEGDSLGDTIRKAKISSPGLQSNIAGIPIALYNAAIETIALAVDAGATITQAIKKAIADHKLDKQKNFDRQEFIRQIEDASGEVYDENEGAAPQTPKEKIAQDDKSILARMVKSDKVSDDVKERLRESGLKYKIRIQKEARAAANSVIDEFGIDDAVTMAEGGRFHGDVNSMIFAVSLDKVFAEEQAGITPEQRQAAAEKWAGIAIRYQDAAESGGRFISAINDFYKKSPAGLVIKIQKEFQRRQDEYFEGREKPTKEAWEEFINTVEGKELLEEEIAKRKTEGRKIFSPESEKKIKSFFSKLRIDTKGTAGSYLLPPQIFNKAIDIIEGAVLGGLSIGKAIDQALDYINDNFKGTWQVKEFKKNIRDGYKNQNVQRVLSESDKDKILKKWQRKLGGLNADERNSLLNKAFLELAENGALEYDDFKQMYAEAAGLPQMTPELAKQLMDLANKINEPDKIKEQIVSTKDISLRPAYEKAIIEAEKASTTLNELIGKQKWWVNTFLTVMRLNTLGFVSLVGNIAYNVAALPVRFATNLTATGLDYLLAGAQLTSDKIFGTDLYKHPPAHNVFKVQGGFVRGLKLGTATAVKQFFTGLTNRDYFQKEVKQNIKPLTSAKRLIRAMTGKEKLSLNEKLNALIEAFPTMGMSAEVIARALNVGDKPFRYAAEFATAERLAQQKGLTGIDKEIFILFPDEASEQRIKAEGEKIVFQQKNIVTKMLDSAGNEVSRFVNELGWETKTLHGIGKTLGYATQPFLNTPLNVFNEFIHYAFPPLPLYKAGKAMVQGDAEKATYHLAQAVTGMSIAYAAGILVANGLVVAAGSGDDEEKERRGIQAYQRQGQLNVSGLKRWLAGEPPENRDGDVWIDLKYYGFVGMMMLAKAKQYRGKTKEEIEQDNYVQDMVGQFIPAVKIGLTEGVFSGTSSLINAMSMGGGYVDNYLLGMGNVVVNAFEPQWLRQISLASNDYYRDPKGMTLPESAKNQLGRLKPQRFFMGDQLPARVNIWGDKVESVPNNTNPYLYNVFGLNKAAVFDNDRFGFVLYDYYNQTKDYNIFPPALRREVNGKALTPHEYEEFSILVGSHRKQLVAPFIESGAFEEMRSEEGGHQKLIDKLTSLYNKGREVAIKEFETINPEFQKPKK